MPQLAGFLAVPRLAVLPGAQIAPGQCLDLRKSSDSGLAVLVDHDGNECLAEETSESEAPAPATQPPSLSCALSVAKVFGAQCYGQVASVDDGTASVRLAVVLPDALWRPHAARKGGTLAGSLFARLAPPALPQLAEGEPRQPARGAVHSLGDAGGDIQQPDPPAGQPQQLSQQQPSDLEQLGSYLSRLQAPLSGLRALNGGQDAFSLPACLLVLPVKASQPDPPPLRAADPSKPSPLAQLDAAPLQLILSKLDPASLRAAAACCRHFRELSLDVAPGLKLTLFPHQRAAVMWMQAREGVAAPQPHPTIAAVRCADVAPGAAAAFDSAAMQLGLPLWVGTSTGGCWAEEPPHARLLDFRGGLFCDEPGLGKTVTGIALLLRTLGMLPAPPPGAEVVWVERSRTGYYLLPREEAASAARMMRRGSEGGRHSLRRTRSSGGAATGGELDQEGPGAHRKAPAAKRLRLAVGCRGGLQRQPEPPRGGQESPAHAAGDAAQVQEAGDVAVVPAAPAWLQCDLCGRWRRLPPGSKAPAGVFACGKNPDGALQRQGCSAPQERFEGADGRADFHPGWVPVGSAQGAPHNLSYYRRLLVDFPSHFPENGQWISPVCWLATQQLRQDADWRIEIKPWDRCRFYPGFSKLFLAIGLEPAWQPGQLGQLRGADNSAAPRRSGAGSGAGLQGSVTSPRQQPARQRRRVSYADEEDSEDAAGASLSDGLRSSGSWLSGEDEEEGGSAGTEQSSSDEGSSVQVAVPAGLRRRRGARARPASLGNCATWRRPDSLAQLELDQEALWQALAEGAQQLPHRVYLSPATLVVVPPPMVDHWRSQIRVHVTRARPAGAAGGEEWLEGRSGIRVAEYTTESKEVARRAGRLLTAQRLAWEADVVLTTMDTMSAEWQAANPIDCSPLMQVHWLRVIVDEGHKLGSTGGMTSKLQMATLLHAERRWVMTGTPTPNTDSASVDSLRPLLAFLHQQPYGTDEAAWRDAVKAPFERRQEEGRLRLLALLQRCMIRASKAELINLGIPPLHTKVVLLDFAPSHAASYNCFVDILRLNMLSSDWYDPDHQESLLNSRRRENREYAAQTLNNVCKSANVAGNCLLQVLASDVDETMQLLTLRELSRQCGAPAEAAPLAHRAQQAGGMAPLAELLGRAGRHWQRRAAHIRACLEEGGACERCGAVVRVLLVAPCACLLCVDCASTDRQRCPCCETAYAMQAVDDPARRADNPHPKWPVPLELIEWQPAFAQRGAKGIYEGFWQPEWQATQSTKCVYLLRWLYEVGAAVPPGRTAGSSRHPTRKAIVYTQFWHHLQLVEKYLVDHGVPLAVLSSAVMKRKEDMRAQLNKFKYLPACGVLLMDASGSVGLDLSFASSVFLMEPIPDQALLEQVVGRAHRMGAKRAVHVEVLAMRGTVEEWMVQRAASTAGAAGAAGTEAAGLQGQPAAGTAARCRARHRGAEERRSAERGALLLALRPVRVADLAEFEDLPGPVPGLGPGRAEQPQQREPQPQRCAQTAAVEQPGLQPPRGAAAAATASYGGSSSDEAEEQEAQQTQQAQQAQQAWPAAGRVSAAQGRQPTWPEVASRAAGPPSGALPSASSPFPPAAAPGAAAGAGNNAAAPAAAQQQQVRQFHAKHRAVRGAPSERTQDDTADEEPSRHGAAPGDGTAGPAGAAATAAAAAAGEAQGSQPAAAAGTPTAQAVQGVADTRVSDTASTAAATGPEASSPAADGPPAAGRRRTVRFADEAEGAGPAPRLRDRLLRRVLAGSVRAGSPSPQAQQQQQGPAMPTSPAGRPMPAAAAPLAATPAAQPAVPVSPRPTAAQPPATAAAVAAAAAQSASQEQVPAAGADVCLLLLQHCQLDAAQAAGLDGQLVGTFTGAFAGMDASQQRHHSSLLPLMLGSGLHSAAAAHIRACLQGLGLQLG